MPPRIRQFDMSRKPYQDNKHEAWNYLRAWHKRWAMSMEELKDISPDKEVIYYKETRLLHEKALAEEGFELTLLYIVKHEQLKLMTAFQSKLPREIRDIVYQYICVSAEPIYLVLDGQEAPRGNSNDTSIIRIRSMLFEREYLGEVAGDELTETYWSMNRFEVTVGLANGTELRALDSLLERAINCRHLLNDWGRRRYFGIYPWQLMRHLKVNVDCEQWCSRERFGNTKLTDYFDDQDEDLTLTWGQMAMSMLETQLECLLKMKGQKELHLELIIKIRLRQSPANVEEKERHLVNIFESLRRYIYELKHSSVEVRVLVCDTDRTRPGCDPISTWDFTSHLTLKAHDWEKEKRQNAEQDKLTGRAEHPQHAAHHYVPQAMPSTDLRGFRELIARRWNVRYALPWVEGAWGSSP